MRSRVRLMVATAAVVTAGALGLPGLLLPVAGTASSAVPERTPADSTSRTPCWDGLDWTGPTWTVEYVASDTVCQEAHQWEPDPWWGAAP